MTGVSCDTGELQVSSQWSMVQHVRAKLPDEPVEGISIQWVPCISNNYAESFLTISKVLFLIHKNASRGIQSSSRKNSMVLKIVGLTCIT